MMINILNDSKSVTVHETTTEDFFDWDSYLKKFYSSYDGKIKNNHIFSCSIADKSDTQLIVYICKSNRDCDKEKPHYCINKGFD